MTSSTTTSTSTAPTPTRPTLGLSPFIFFANQIVYDHAEYGTYLSQCLTTIGKNERGDRTYKYGWGGFLIMQRHPQWRRHFYDIGVNGKELIDNSRAINSPNYELIARTVMLMSTQLTTDAFGDMPREEAYQSNSPKYDTQASIYAWMFQEAEDLLAMYNDPTIVNSPENRLIDVKRDRIYAGDLNKWKGLVLAVKARLLLRNLPNIDRSAATCQKIIAAADAAIDCCARATSSTVPGSAMNPRYNFDGWNICTVCLLGSRRYPLRHLAVVRQQPRPGLPLEVFHAGSARRSISR